MITLDEELPEVTLDPVPVSDAAIELCTRLEGVFSETGRPIRRLGSAGTSVKFRILDAERGSLTILLDRHPPMVLYGDEPAEVVIELTTQQAAVFGRGALSLPNAILGREVRCYGPVRKYLAVDPIIRARLNARGRFARGG